MSTDARKVRNQASIRALLKFLDQVRSSPLDYLDDLPLRQALASQGKLAGFARPSVNVVAMTLNTAKQAASAVLDGGYDMLDRLRRTCLDTLEAAETRVRTPKRNSKTGLRSEIDHLKEANQVLREDLMVFTQAFTTSIKNSRNYAAQSDAATQELCAKECRELIAALGLVRTPLALRWINALRNIHET